MLNYILSYLKWIWNSVTMAFSYFERDLWWKVGLFCVRAQRDQGCVIKKQKFHQVQFNRTILATEKTLIYTICFICNAGLKLTDCIEVWRQHCCFDTVHPTQDVPEHLMELLLSWTNGAVGYSQENMMSSKEGSRDTEDRSNDADLSSAAVYSSAHETRAPGTQDTPDTRPD